jgi:2'-5' RNA ligase
MRDAAARASWVAESRLHLTVKFLGEQPECGADRLRETLRPVLARHPALSLAIGGLGAFPNLQSPRVVWMGVERDPRLELMHHDVESICGTLGHEVDGRAFRPHITLGRVRDRLSAPAARALAGAARGVQFAGQVEMTTLDLMESQLVASGPRYRMVVALPLGG